jgi:hypothetical protein
MWRLFWNPLTVTEVSPPPVSMPHVHPGGRIEGTVRKVRWSDFSRCEDRNTNPQAKSYIINHRQPVAPLLIQFITADNIEDIESAIGIMDSKEALLGKMRDHFVQRLRWLVDAAFQPQSQPQPARGLGPSRSSRSESELLPKLLKVVLNLILLSVREDVVLIVKNVVERVLH